MSDIPSSVANYGIAAILAFKFGPEIVKGIFRKNGSSNGICHVPDVLPIVLNHTSALEEIKHNTSDIRDGVRGLCTIMDERKKRGR